MIKVDSFTVSYSLDCNLGKRSSNFLSMNFKLPEAVPIDQIDAIRAEASRKVTRWVIQDAVMRGEMTQEEARERMETLGHNFAVLQDALERKSTKEMA
jgi:hypothetical protein